MKIEKIEFETTSETELLLRTVGMAIAFGMCSPSDQDFDDHLAAINAGIAQVFSEFQRLKEGEKYDEAEWAINMILSGIHCLRMAKLGKMQAVTQPEEYDDEEA